MKKMTDKKRLITPYLKGVSKKLTELVKIELRSIWTPNIQHYMEKHLGLVYWHKQY